MAYGSSQARGRIETTAAGLYHSHSKCQIRAASATYTTAYGNAGSLTHWAGPGFEPASSWILVGFIFTEPQWELLDFFFLNKRNMDPIILPNTYTYKHTHTPRYMPIYTHICILFLNLPSHKRRFLITGVQAPQMPNPGRVPWSCFMTHSASNTFPTDWSHRRATTSLSWSVKNSCVMPARGPG